MRVSRALLACLAAMLLGAALAHAAASTAQAQAEVAALSELESWLVARDTAAALAAPAKADQSAPAKAAPKLQSLKKLVQLAPHAGTVQMGGFVPPSDTPNLDGGAADGSTLPPFDPFGIAQRHERLEAWRQKRRQVQVDKVNAAERAKAAEQLERRRAQVLAREQAEAARETAAEKAALLAKAGLDDQKYETDLIEAGAEADASDEHAAMLEQQADAAEAAADRAEAEADVLLESQVEAQMEADIQAQLDAEAEGDAEAKAEGDSLVEADAEAESESEAESEAEAEAEGESHSGAGADAPSNPSSESLPDAYHALMELKASDAPLKPSLPVTYGSGSFSEQHLDNDDSRAVFARRALAQQVVRFEKAITSDGGVAVVNGVTKLPCGKEVTDMGLSAAVVSANPGATVEAADPQAPVLHDDNIVAIKKLPVLPQFHAEQTADEYGDMPSE